MTQKRCQLCSQLSSKFEKLLNFLLGKKNNCQKLFNRIDGKDKDRLDKINQSASDCACERYRASKHSPSPVEDNEIISRFIYSPMFYRSNGKLNNSVFAHVKTVGCSVQREDIATDNEILRLAMEALKRDSKQSCTGVLLAKVDDLRKISVGSDGKRDVCVYDTANKVNPAHAEISKSRSMDEADFIQLRYELSVAFRNNEVHSLAEYRGGLISNRLDSSLIS